MQSLEHTKQQLRKQLLWLWKITSAEDKADREKKLAGFLANHADVRAADSIALYAPLTSELLFFADWFELFPHKQFFFPQVSQQQLLFVRCRSLEEARRLYRTPLTQKTTTREPPAQESVIQEPSARESATQALPRIDLFFVPALAVDQQGIRLGRGQGFYDRFFQQNPTAAAKIAVLPDFVRLERLPADPWDLTLDACCWAKKEQLEWQSFSSPATNERA